MTTRLRVVVTIACIACLTISKASADDAHFLFEVAGEHKAVGDWTVVFQRDKAKFMITGGDTERGRYMDAVNLKAPASSLQVMCENGEIWSLAAIPSTDTIPFERMLGSKAYIIIYRDGNPSPLQETVIVKEKVVGNFYVVPIFSGRPGSNGFKGFKASGKLSVKYFTPNMDYVIADFHIRGLAGALETIEPNCQAASGTSAN